MPRTAALLTALALVTAGGLAHGLATSRWHRPEALDAALARVPEVPRVLGAWKGRDLEADAATFAQARAEAYWVRRYENPAGDAVTVILMCGPAGPLAVHTPDVCYRGAGYAMAGRAEVVEVPLPGGPARLWSARFQKDPPGPGGPLRLFWSWSDDGAWEAPAFPRLAFAGRPALYKLYVSHEEPAGQAAPADDPARAFLPELLPALDRALFRPAGR